MKAGISASTLLSSGSGTMRVMHGKSLKERAKEYVNGSRQPYSGTCIGDSTPQARHFPLTMWLIVQFSLSSRRELLNFSVQLVPTLCSKYYMLLWVMNSSHVLGSEEMKGIALMVIS